MKVYIYNLYGIKDGKRAYYRKSGIFGFDFANSIEFASELTEEEANEILKHKDWYCKQFNAEGMEKVE